MAAPRSASLRRRYTGRPHIPLLLFAGGACIALGLTTPALETSTLMFWRNEYSVLINIQQLSRDGRHAAAAILAMCSVAYPAAKLCLLAFFWLFPFPARWRWNSIRVIRILGRWGMVDVFTMATIVLASLAIGPLQASPRPGLYFYAGGIACLSIAGVMMDRMARCR